MKKSPAATHWWDWSAIALLFILLETLATRLVSTSWTPFLYLIQMFTSLGFTIGTILGYSRLKRGTARWLSLLYMLIFLPLQWTLIIDQRVSLEEQLGSVWGRLVFSVGELVARRPVDDPFFFVAVMSISFWIVSASAGFSLTRYQNYLRAVVPSAVGILVIQHYDNAVPGRVWILAFFTFVALLLLGRMYFLQNQASWSSRRVFISAENRFDLTGGMAVLAGLIIFASFAIPASRAGFEGAIRTWNRVTRPWNEFTEKLENAVSALDSPSGGRPGEFYGTELSLGRGFPLSEAIMFTVEVSGIPGEDAPPRYYWRGRTYDHYLGGKWYTTGTTREEFSPVGNNPSLPDTADGIPYSFKIGVGETRFSLLYAPAQPVWFSRPGSFLASPAGPDKDVVSWNATPSLLPGETYEIRAVLNNPNTKELREAGTNYPEWVAAKYLQIPENFSPRIVELAEEITTDADNPYDKAVAITRYLRETVKYAPTLPPPPRNRDILEWILFEHQEAYCVYYATAEVMMLRSLGIPARVAVGFSQGDATTTQYNNETILTTYTVRKRNAHAWPEVYFPGIGWIEFESTGNQATLDRPLPPPDPTAESTSNGGPAATPLLEDDVIFGGREQELEEGLTPVPQPEETVFPRLILIALLTAFAALTVFLSRRYQLPVRVPVFIRTTMERNGGTAPNWVVRWERWTMLSPIEKAFESINFGLRQLKQPTPIHSTPSERAKALSGILPQLAEPVKILLDEHQTSLYTSRIANVSQARRAARAIRLQIVLARVRRFFIGTYAIHS